MYKDKANLDDEDNDFFNKLLAQWSILQSSCLNFEFKSYIRVFKKNKINRFMIKPFDNNT